MANSTINSIYRRHYDRFELYLRDAESLGLDSHTDGPLFHACPFADIIESLVTVIQNLLSLKSLEVAAATAATNCDPDFHL